MPQIFGLVGFGAAFAAFAGVLILVVTSHPGTRQAYFINIALVASMFWAAMNVQAIWQTSRPLIWMPITDALHTAAWVALVAVFLIASSGGIGARRIGIGVLSVGAVFFLTVLFSPIMSQSADQNQISGLSLIALLALPLLGLLSLEQVLRNSAFAERRAVRPMVIGIGLIFAFDVFCYSQVFIFSEINVIAWELRGIGNAIAAPFVLVAIKRQQEWERDLFLSREVVFHTASLVAVGAYLLLIGLVGSLIGPFDGTGRAFLEVGILLAAGAVFAYALFSSTLRRRFKVFIAKHFFRNRYDYRREWLRFIETLAGSHDDASVSQRGVKALAEIIESPRGVLWWSDEENEPLKSCGAWETDEPKASLSADSALVAFLVSSHWVIDTEEYRRAPEMYQDAFDGCEQEVLEPPSIYVPLTLDGALRGVVRLDRRPDLGNLSFEDHDLLKTAGKQVAVFLAQERIQASLAETRQFEAYNRLTTFLMHDLKNMIAQQELVVGNAKRFKHKPEFVDDAIRTIDASVKRMRSVLERLQSHGQEDAVSPIDVSKLLVEVVASCGDRLPNPVIGDSVQRQGLVVRMNKDKLTMALTHVIRNAQDATPDSGAIEVSLSNDDESVVVEIKDSGAGMSPEFLRERLFRPFDSTKGAQGMGIGAYQVRETIRAAGGDVRVRSSLNEGTQFRIRLPLSGQLWPSAAAALGGV